MDKIYFKHEVYGKCKILGFFKSIAIIEIKNKVERYVVADGFSLKTKQWSKGYYFRNYDEAISAYAFLAFD